MARSIAGGGARVGEGVAKVMLVAMVAVAPVARTAALATVARAKARCARLKQKQRGIQSGLADYQESQC